jgi:hypothetical protein
MGEVGEDPWCPGAGFGGRCVVAWWQLHKTLQRPVDGADIAAPHWGPDSVGASQPACVSLCTPVLLLLPLPLPLRLPQVPLDRADCQLRANEVGSLRQWVSAPSEALRRDQSPILTPEYMARIVPRLTSGELCGLYPWEQLATGGSSGRCPWYYPGLLKVG